MRLIIVPQYPTKLRYQEWWWSEFPAQLALYFSDILVLGNAPAFFKADAGHFAPAKKALQFELSQIEQYMELELKDDDVLLLNDLSFPGLFSRILLHKKPKHCFAICHATSKNRYDYFANIRHIKYHLEKTEAKLFDKIIVGSEYHAKKLRWDNIKVLPLPIIPIYTDKILPKVYNIVSVARKSVQKRTHKIESRLEQDFQISIITADESCWEDYYEFLNKSKIMLITSKEETFGYQIIDAIINGCIPVAPNKFSYPELLPKEYLYDSYDELINIIAKALIGKLAVPELKVGQESSRFYQNLSELIWNETQK